MSGQLSIPIVEKEGRLTAMLPSARVARGGPSGIYKGPKVNKTSEITPPIFPYEETAGYRWAPWGAKDEIPTLFRQKIQQVPMAGQAIHKLMLMMYGDGIAYYRNRDVEGSSVQRAYIPTVENFLKKNRIRTHYLPAQFMDYRYYTNTFSEMVLSRDKQQILGLYHKEAEFCRLSVQKEDTGVIEYLYYSPRFAEGYYPNDSQIAAIQLLDFWNYEEWLEKMNGAKFAWHSKLPSPGVQYYAMPPWIALFKDNGWLDVSSEVPHIISTMQKQQIVLKYHIQIPESYFEVRYPEWQTYTNQRREILINTLIDTINDTLSGTDDIFKSIATIFRDTSTGQALGKIEVIAVDDKLKKDSWVPSSSVADAQIVQGLGIHPSQIGLSPEGGKMGAGSGSDQREGFNTAISLNTLEQQIVLEALQFVADYNARTNPEWDITFFISHTPHTTTNNQESGLQPTETSLIID